MTMPTVSRSESSVRSRTSWPSTSTRPSTTSWIRGTSSAVVVLPAPDGPTSATSSPGSTVKRDVAQDPALGSSSAAHDHALLERRDRRHRRPAGAGTTRGRTSTRPARVDEVDGAGALGDERREVEHLEDPLERHERGHHVDAGVRELRERLVDLADVDDERGDGADRRSRRSITRLPPT